MKLLYLINFWKITLYGLFISIHVHLYTFYSSILVAKIISTELFFYLFSLHWSLKQYTQYLFRRHTCVHVNHFLAKEFFQTFSLHFILLSFLSEPQSKYFRKSTPGNHKIFTDAHHTCNFSKKQTFPLPFFEYHILFIPHIFSHLICLLTHLSLWLPHHQCLFTPML